METSSAVPLNRISEKIDVHCVLLLKENEKLLTTLYRKGKESKCLVQIQLNLLTRWLRVLGFISPSYVVYYCRQNPPRYFLILDR